MVRLFRALLIVAALTSPAPLLAQGTASGDTLWVGAPAGTVGRQISISFADAADRAALLREEMALPTVDGRAWAVRDLVVTLDVGTRAADITWRVAGPAAVIDAFEAAVRKQAEQRPSTLAVRARTLVVR